MIKTAKCPLPACSPGRQHGNNKIEEGKSGPLYISENELTRQSIRMFAILVLQDIHDPLNLSTKAASTGISVEDRDAFFEFLGALASLSQTLRSTATRRPVLGPELGDVAALVLELLEGLRAEHVGERRHDPVAQPGGAADVHVRAGGDLGSEHGL